MSYCELTADTLYFLLAIKSNHETASIRMLSEKQVDINAKDKFGNNAAHYAAMQGMDELIKELIQRNINLNEQNDMGKTPVHFAASENKATTINLLLENNANAKIKDFSGALPLTEALNNGHIEATKALIVDADDIRYIKKRGYERIPTNKIAKKVRDNFNFVINNKGVQKIINETLQQKIIKLEKTMQKNMA